jgi:hypothetical protein
MKPSLYSRIDGSLNGYGGPLFWLTLGLLTSGLSLAVGFGFFPLGAIVYGLFLLYRRWRANRALGALVRQGYTTHEIAAVVQAQAEEQLLNQGGRRCSNPDCDHITMTPRAACKRCRVSFSQAATV